MHFEVVAAVVMRMVVEKDTSDLAGGKRRKSVQAGVGC